MIARRLIVPVTLAVLAAHTTAAGAQGAFPAPLPGNNASPFPPVNGAPVNGAVPPPNDSAFPPINGATARPTIGTPTGFPAGGAPPISGGFAQPQRAGPPDDCMKAFLPLRQEAEKRSTAIKFASEHHATPDVACKAFRSFGEAELKLIKYIATNQARCGIPAQVGDQLKAGHKNTEMMQEKVCAVAAQGPRAPAGPSLSDVLGSSPALPEATAAKKSGGSTFDTLSGNVLSR